MMSVSGLAEGFLAGFNTMDRYQRGQKEDERMDKAMGLRDAMWQNEQERQKVADERYQSDLAYREGRDKLADAKYDKQFALTERQMKASEARAGAAERRAAAQEARQQQEYEWQKTLRTSSFSSRRTCRLSSLAGRLWPRAKTLASSSGTWCGIRGLAL